MAVSLGQPGAHIVLEGVHLPRARVRVEWSGGAHLASQQLVNRYTGALAQDVPQRAVYTAERVVQRHATAEVGLHVGRLPDVFDVVHVPPDNKRLHVLLYGGGYGQRPLAMCGTAEPVKAWFAGENLHDDGVVPVRLRQDHLDVGDPHR